MTESTGQRPYGGVNERPDDGSLPGETAEHDRVGAEPAAEPRAAEAPMSDDVTRTPRGENQPDSKGGGIADATGPQG